MTGRHIVVHHCIPGQVKPGLFIPGDTVFFDDCLWSQYRFILDNAAIMRSIRIILGFSPGLARPCHMDPIQLIESEKAHDAVNKAMSCPTDKFPEEIRTFMSVDEVRKLLEIDNVQLAMHGCMHLKLEQISGKTQRLAVFRRDLQDGIGLFWQYSLASDIFVYPYAFCEDGYDYVVKKSGFRESYARPGAYRTAVENLIDEHTGIEDS